MKFFASLACVSLLAAAAPAFAQTPPAQDPLPPVAGGGARAPATPEMVAARRNMRSACAADIASFCGDAAPAATAPAAGQRGGARLQCLRGHVTQVSAPCRQAMAAMRDARKASK